MRCYCEGENSSKQEKRNDRPTDIFSGEAGDDRSLPSREENGTAPKRVACQSLEDRTANAKLLLQGKEGILPMAEQQSFMKVEEVAQELGISKSYAYKIVQKLNAELKSLGYLTISGRVNRKYFMEKLCYGGAERKEK